MGIPLRTRAFWAVFSLADRTPTMQQPAEKVRAASEARKRSLDMPGAWLIAGKPERGVDISDGELTLPDGTNLPTRTYRPTGAAGPLPVVVNFHGGGFVSGDVAQSQWWCSAIAARAGVTVVSVDYRLAPEHPFPGPPEDCYAATVWVAEHAAELGVDASRIAVMGDSAGGNLAAVVCLMSRDRGGPEIALQILLYPAVDFATEFASKQENAHAPILSAKDMDNVPRLYFTDPARDEVDPYASPLRGKHDGLPPALIQTAQFDPLRDEGAAYADALRAAGVPVRLTNYVDAVHGYISLPGLLPMARQALHEAATAVREALRP